MRGAGSWRPLFMLGILVVLGGLAGGALWWRALPDGLRGLTGEEPRAAQIRGLGHWLSGRLRPYPAAEPLVPVRHAGLYPFGVNTFLQSESEPEKVERALDMIAEGGFRWIRQEFTWEDLEIHQDGWYVDLRNARIQNSWDKYDRIVDLAEARGIEIIVRLSNPPEWSRATGDEGGAKGPPDVLEDYGDYVAAVVGRYRGRIRYYQVWNEPNCCEEWGRARVSPEEYVELLRVAHTRAREADPESVILTAPLAPTIALTPQDVGTGTPALNDFLFLQRMYDAGAAPYFDILAVQDYGLWSGPTDRRMRPRVINYSRPEYIRDIMIRNGDASKAIWASEVGWNSTPPSVGVYPFGATPEEWRGGYLAGALERQQQEWPWMGVTTIWFFKPPDESEIDQPQYYFRLVEPDFTPLLAWEELTAYIRDLEPTLYRGYHQEDHWVLRESLPEGRWPIERVDGAVLGAVARGTMGETLAFGVEGDALTLVAGPGSRGRLAVAVGATERALELDGAAELDLGPLPPGRTAVTLEVLDGEISLDAVIVR